MAISRPRTRRISSSVSVSRSRPLNRIRPAVIRPAGCSTSRMMLSALTDLPHPDSPTRATVSPASTSQDTPSTARTTPVRVANSVWRSITSRSFATVVPDYTTWGHFGAPCKSNAAGDGEMLVRVVDERGVLATDGLRHARPAVAGGPADALAAKPPSQRAVAEHPPDRRRQRTGIALGHQEAGQPVADGRLQPADAGGDDRAPAGHGLEGHHTEGLVVGRQHGGVGGDVVVA